MGRRDERIKANGQVMLLCIYHREKTPSLQLSLDGRFYCHGCGEYGLWTEVPELVSKQAKFRAQMLEHLGQLRFDWA